MYMYIYIYIYIYISIYRTNKIQELKQKSPLATLLLLVYIYMFKKYI